MEKIETSNLDRYCCIDIETTGFSYRNDRIIEIAILKITNGEITDQFSTLINPKVNISIHIENLTHITNDMIKDKPFFSDISEQIIEFIGDSVILGHNVRFDFDILSYNLLYYNNYVLKNKVIDTLAIAKSCIANIENYKLGTICDFLQISENKTHRAEADARNTYKVLETLKKNFSQHITNIRDFIFEIDNTEKFKESDNSITKPYSHRKSISIKEIAATVEMSDLSIDEDFNGKVFVFTGELKKLTREQAYAKVIAGGGTVLSTVSKNTSILVNADSVVTSKIKKALEMQEKGTGIKIISDETFMKMLESTNKIEE